MLDQYLENLVKESQVNNKLDAHLEGLRKQAAEEVALQQFLEKASVGDLAKLAGVELPQDICSGCGSQMEKLGSVFQCQCGMMKKAVDVGSSKDGPLQVVHRTSAAPITKGEAKGERAGRRVGNIAGTAAGGLGGAGLGALSARYALPEWGKLGTMLQSLPPGKAKALKAALLAGGGLAGLAVGAGAGGFGGRMAGGSIGQSIGGMGKSSSAKTAAQEKTASFVKFAEAVESCGGDVDKALVHLERQGYTKLGFSLAGVGQALKGLKGVGSKALNVAKAAPGAAKNTAKQLKSTYQMGTEGIARQGGKLTPTGQTGVMGGLKAVAKGNPGLTAGAAGAAGLGAGYALGKTGSAEKLAEVGDAAGRILAKIAAGEAPPSLAMANATGQPMMTAEELEEAIQSAQGREDIQGRAQRWGRAGAGLGGGAGLAMGGGAGYGIGRALGKPLLGAGIGALGGAGLGGLIGQRVGTAEGAEEAAADKLVSMLRARRAFNAGTGHGYMAGLGHGLGYQGGQGDQGGEDPQ